MQPVEIFKLLKDAPDLEKVELTLQSLAALQTSPIYKATHIIVGNNVWVNIIADPEFNKVLDPSSTLSDLTSGMLGVIFGMDVIGQAFLSSEKLLDLGIRRIHPDYIAVVSVHSGEIKRISQALAMEPKRSVIRVEVTDENGSMTTHIVVAKGKEYALERLREKLGPVYTVAESETLSNLGECVHVLL